MKIGKYLVAKIQADATLNTLIGGRVYPTMMPQNAAYPAVVFTASGAPADNSKQQAATTDKGTVRFHIWAATHAECEDIDAALRAALDYVPGTAGDVTVTGAECRDFQDGMDDKLECFLRARNYDFRVLR